jgi:hypothetical protein
VEWEEGLGDTGARESINEAEEDHADNCHDY